MGGLRTAIAGGGRLCRTRHEPRVDRRVKRDRHPVANPAGSPAIATPSPDAGEKMGARLDGQPQALPGRAALQRWISSCWFLFERTRENCASQETSYERAGHAAPGANLLLQYGLLRCASRKCEIGPGPFARQFQNGSIISRHREERSRSQGDPGIDLIGGTVAAATRVRRKCGRHRGRPSMFV